MASTSCFTMYTSISSSLQTALSLDFTARGISLSTSEAAGSCGGTSQ